MTCICGHHEHAHAQDVGLCGSPHGCDCNQFRKAPAIPDPFVDEAKARQDAEWLAGSEADTAERNLARAYLALREQVATLTADNERLRGERAIADNARLHAQLAALRSPVPSGEGVTQHTTYPTGAFAATPQPERLEIPVEDGMVVRITPSLARRLLALAQTEGK